MWQVIVRVIRWRRERDGNMWQVIVRVIRWRRERWAGHVASRGKGEVHTEFWWWKP